MRVERTRLLDRREQHRDARIFVIATEGTETEKQYFEGLRERAVIDRSRVKVEVLATGADGRSAPRHVIDRLDAFARGHDLKVGLDQLWLVVDLDHRKQGTHQRQLPEMATLAAQKDYRLAVSNPCFELWLLLHFVNVESAADCEECDRRLRAELGAYNASNLDLNRYRRDGIERAIARASVLDSPQGKGWPQSTGSHVYRLMNELLGK